MHRSAFTAHILKKQPECLRKNTFSNFWYDGLFRILDIVIANYAIGLACSSLPISKYRTVHTNLELMNNAYSVDIGLIPYSQF